MALILDIHPINPQMRLINKVTETLQKGGVIAYPTDSGYALGCTLGNKSAMERIVKIRQLKRHHQVTKIILDRKRDKLIHTNIGTPRKITFAVSHIKELAYNRLRDYNTIPCSVLMSFPQCKDRRFANGCLSLSITAHRIKFMYTHTVNEKKEVAA